MHYTFEMAARSSETATKISCLRSLPYISILKRCIYKAQERGCNFDMRRGVRIRIEIDARPLQRDHVQLGNVADYLHEWLAGKKQHLSGVSCCFHS